MRRFGRLDILVNNAGGSAAGPLLEMDDAIWHGDLDTKLFGALRCSRLAIPHMIEAGGGRIINVTSIWGKHPGRGDCTHHGVPRGGHRADQGDVA